VKPRLNIQVSDLRKSHCRKPTIEYNGSTAVTTLQPTSELRTTDKMYSKTTVRPESTQNKPTKVLFSQHDAYYAKNKLVGYGKMENR